jgi:hypothetical protein
MNQYSVLSAMRSRISVLASQRGLASVRQFDDKKDLRRMQQYVGKRTN